MLDPQTCNSWKPEYVHGGSLRKPQVVLTLLGSNLFISATSWAACPAGRERKMLLDQKTEMLCQHRSKQSFSRRVTVSMACVPEFSTRNWGAARFFETEGRSRDEVLRGFNHKLRAEAQSHGGKNPAALFCTYRGGIPHIAEHPSGAQDTVCRASDNSLILAWDLYNAFNP
jgi:putative hemolysin